MADVNRLVFSIIEFLQDQKKNTSLDEEQVESIEVAVQCLEAAYGVKVEDEATKAKYRVQKNLLDIFNAQVGIEPDDLSSLSLHEPTPEEKQEAEELKNQGNECMKTERFSDALECYSQALKRDGNNAVYYCNRAAAYSKLSEHKLAIEDCHKALAIDPLYSKAYGRMGIAYTALEDHESALECYRKALELDPGNQSYHNNLEISEQKLQEQAARSGFNMGSMPGMMPDMAALLNNPAMMSMAQNMMQNPAMQQMMANMVGGASQGAGGQPDIGNILSMGQQIAQQMQQQNPELVSQLREQMGRPPNPGGENNPQPPNPPGPEGGSQ